MKILVFVPARGGSKSINNKNLQIIGGKKLIDYTLDLTLKFGRDFFTFISTDSNKIIKHCLSRDIDMEYVRPSYLSADSSDIIDVIFHGLKWLKTKKNYSPDAVLLLQPTSPMRNFIEIKKAINKFKKTNASSMVGVVPVVNHPYECVVKKNKGWSFVAKPKKKITRRQDYNNEYYFIDGSFYIVKVEFLYKFKSLVYENKTLLFNFLNKYSIDIDDYSDLKVAKSLLVQ